MSWNFDFIWLLLKINQACCINKSYTFFSVCVCDTYSMWNITKIGSPVICKNTPEWQKIVTVRKLEDYLNLKSILYINSRFFSLHFQFQVDSCFNVIDWVPHLQEYFRFVIRPIPLINCAFNPSCPWPGYSQHGMIYLLVGQMFVNVKGTC